MQSSLYFEDLSEVLKINAEHLTDLHLEYASERNGTPIIHSNHDYDLDDEGGPHYNNHFSREVLGLTRSHASPRCIFPKLSSLALAFVPLENAEKVLEKSLNVSDLQHLSLRKCAGMEDFIKAAIELGQVLKLSSLEYHAMWEDAFGLDRILKSFFGMVPALTDLFLSLADHENTLDIWHSIVSNKLPLKRSVYHQRHSPYYEINDRDLVDLTLDSEEQKELEGSGAQHPFAQLNLEWLGLSLDPLIAVS